MRRGDIAQWSLLKLSKWIYVNSCPWGLDINILSFLQEMAIEHCSQKSPLRMAKTIFFSKTCIARLRKWLVLTFWYLLSLCANGIANHTGPIGGPCRRQRRRLPSDLQDPRRLTTLDLHLLGRERRPWGAQHTHWIRRERKTAQQWLNHFCLFDQKIMCWPQYKAHSITFSQSYGMRIFSCGAAGGDWILCLEVYSLTWGYYYKLYYKQYVSFLHEFTLLLQWTAGMCCDTMRRSQLNVASPF